MNKLTIFCCITFLFSIYKAQSDELKIEAMVIKYDEQCKNEIEITSLDGKAPFTYSIDAGKTFGSENVFTGLCRQKLFIQVRDADGKLGLTFLDLSQKPNIQENIFSTEQSLAIKQNMINSLKSELLNHSKGSFEYRQIQWKLSRLGELQTPELDYTEEAGRMTTVIDVLIPPVSTESQYESQIDRLKQEFPYLIIGTMDYTNWQMPVSFPSDIKGVNEFNRFMNFIGFKNALTR